jgi:hypothetical protein
MGTSKTINIESWVVYFVAAGLFGVTAGLAFVMLAIKQPDPEIKLLLASLFSFFAGSINIIISIDALKKRKKLRTVLYG